MRPVVALSLLISTALVARGNSALDVGGRKQLFVDQRFIESSEGVVLTVNPPHQTGERLLVIDQPWEKGAYLQIYASILKEAAPGGARIRLWYDLAAGDGHPGKGFRAVAYAESSDGIHFRKPVLGLVEKEGSRQNNLVMPTDLSQMTVGGGSVALDENPACPPSARYKSWSKLYTRRGKFEGDARVVGDVKGENRIWHSADGLRWNLYETAPTGLRASDTQPTWFWDASLGRYLGYSRELPPRMVGYNESDDMLHWRNFALILKPDERDLSALTDFLPHSPLAPPRERAAQVDPVFGKGFTVVGGLPMDFYGPGVFKYKEAEDTYLALFSVYYHWGEEGPSTGDVQLAVSRDGFNFRRMGGRRPFLRVGRAGTFWSKWVWALPQPIRMGDELWIYYMGTNRDHQGRVDPASPGHESALSRAILRLDGFVSADADYSGGWLRTPPLVFEGRGLELNLDTSAGGLARVEIQDAGGKPIPGYGMNEADSLNGNGVRLPASWRGSRDVSALSGRPVRLHFKLRDCKLYAFQFSK